MVKKGPSLMERMDTAPTSGRIAVLSGQGSVQSAVGVGQSAYAGWKVPKSLSPKKSTANQSDNNADSNLYRCDDHAFIYRNAGLLKINGSGVAENKNSQDGHGPDFHRYVVKVPSNALHKTFPKKVLTIAPQSRHYHQTSLNLLNCL